MCCSLYAQTIAGHCIQLASCVRFFFFFMCIVGTRYVDMQYVHILNTNILPLPYLVLRATRTLGLSDQFSVENVHNTDGIHCFIPTISKCNQSPSTFSIGMHRQLMRIFNATVEHHCRRSRHQRHHRHCLLPIMGFMAKSRH
jgi:hypothetical protein